MVVGSLRRIAFVALLAVLALDGQVQSAGARLPQARSPLAIQMSASIAGPPARDSTTDPRNTAPVVTPPLSPPVRLQIPSLGIDAKVEALGLDRTGAMATPRNIWNVGWYQGGPSPGDSGDAVIDGHVGLPGSPLVFSHLAKLAIGSEVIAVLADGTRSRFMVTDMQRWPADSQPTDLFDVYGQPRLSLITCTGDYYRASQTYADRLVVNTSYLGPD